MTPEKAQELNDAFAKHRREYRKQAVAAGVIRPGKGEQKPAETGI